MAAKDPADVSGYKVDNLSWLSQLSLFPKVVVSAKSELLVLPTCKLS